MPIRALPVCLSSLLLSALMAFPTPWARHDDEYEAPNGSRVCLGGLGRVVCVPPDEMPPSPPSAPNLPSVPSE